MTSIAVRYESGRLVATIIGELTLNSLDELARSLGDISTTTETDILVDMIAVTHMDPAGAGMLAALANRLTPRGLELHLTSPQPAAERMLTELGVTKIAPIEYTPTSQYRH